MIDSSMSIPPEVPTRIVLLQRGAIRSLPGVMAEVGAAPGAQCLLVHDRNTWQAAGRQVKEVLEQAGYGAMPLELSCDAHGHVPGTTDQVRQVAQASGGATEVVVGIGSGVINDLGKLASLQAGRKYVAVATAASMNGYGSPIAAIIDGGVKKTLPAAATAAIVADLDVLAAAPADMTRSGFADLLSKFNATADWMLAHLVRDEPYNPRPKEVLDRPVAACLVAAEAIGRGEPEAMALLARGLVAGGFAMTIAGHSAPASGGEHLISHLWDMQAQFLGTPHALHGYQVAIGTRVTAAVYQQLFRLRPQDIDVDRLAARWMPWEQRREQVRQAHGGLFAAVELESRRQFLDRGQLREELVRIRSSWERIRLTLEPMLLGPDRLLELHRAANVPVDPTAVGQSRQSVRHAMLHAADVRARFTVLALARELGVLDADADQILDAAGL